jgi:hypothetical protein
MSPSSSTAKSWTSVVNTSSSAIFQSNLIPKLAKLALNYPDSAATSIPDAKVVEYVASPSNCKAIPSIHILTPISLLAIRMLQLAGPLIFYLMSQ